MRAFQQYRAKDYKIKIQMIPHAWQETCTIWGGLKWKGTCFSIRQLQNRKKTHTPNTLMGITDNRNVKQGSCTTLSLAKTLSLSESNWGFVLRCKLDEITNCRHSTLRKGPTLPQSTWKHQITFTFPNHELEMVSNKNERNKKAPLKHHASQGMFPSSPIL